MTDLTTRIADVKKRAEEATQSTEMYFEEVDTLVAFHKAASPSLFIEMADEIARLTAELEKAREALEPFAEASTSYSTNRDHDQYCVDEWGRIEAGHLRTAARVSEELKEALDAGRQTPRS